MSINKEQVADLREGDVVELFRNSWPDGTVVRGALYEASGWLYVAEEAVRGDNVRPVLGASYTLTVVSRVPRLYVNHRRTEPVPGDVVRDADSDDAKVWFVLDDSGIHGSPWASWGAPDYDVGITWDWFSRDELPVRLRLLVDGETGRCVP